MVQASLQRAAAPYGLRFGPGSVHPHPLHDRRDDRQQRLRTARAGLRQDRRQRGRPGRGHRLRRAAAPWTRRTPWTSTRRPSLHALQSVVAADLGTIRTEFGRFGRQVSGYSLEHLLPERRFDVARFLAGTEGTLAVITRATVRLVADAPHKIMIALGYPSHGRGRRRRPDPRSTSARPRSRVWTGASSRWSAAPAGAAAVPPLPRGDGWVFVELVGDDPGELAVAGRPRCWPRPAAWTAYVVADPAQAARAVEDPRGRRRPGRGQPGRPGVPGLGGRGRPAGAARRLPARLRRAAGRATACTACRTGTSATAACTSGSTSR